MPTPRLVCTNSSSAQARILTHVLPDRHLQAGYIPMPRDPQDRPGGCHHGQQSGTHYYDSRQGISLITDRFAAGGLPQDRITDLCNFSFLFFGLRRRGGGDERHEGELRREVAAQRAWHRRPPRRVRWPTKGGAGNPPFADGAARLGWPSDGWSGLRREVCRPRSDQPSSAFGPNVRFDCAR